MWFTFLAKWPCFFCSFLDFSICYFTHAMPRLHSLHAFCHFTIILLFCLYSQKTASILDNFFYFLLPHFLTLTGTAMSVRLLTCFHCGRISSDSGAGIGSGIRNSLACNSFRLHSWGTHTRCGPLEHYDHNHFGGILRMNNCGLDDVSNNIADGINFRILSLVSLRFFAHILYFC